MLFDRDRYLALLHTAELGRHLEYHQRVGSTMDLAREASAAAGPHGTVILADEQAAGRGRRGRSFHSPPGENLYFTIILRGDRVDLASLPMALPLAVARAIGDWCPGTAIKWPNDIWIDERKCCGMLIDVITTPGAVALAGIGINVNGDPTLNPELAGTATSLARELGHAVEREGLLARIMDELETWLAADPTRLAEGYRERSNTLGRTVDVTPAVGEPFSGLATGLGESGSLLVQTEDGATREVDAADVSVRPRG